MGIEPITDSLKDYHSTIELYARPLFKTVVVFYNIVRILHLFFQTNTKLPKLESNQRPNA